MGGIYLRVGWLAIEQPLHVDLIVSNDVRANADVLIHIKPLARCAAVSLPRIINNLKHTASRGPWVLRIGAVSTLCTCHP